MMIVIFIMSIILLSRLFFLQVIEKEKFSTLSERNQLTVIPFEAKRGLIYDRNGKILAKNYSIYNIEIVL
ncbi:MAG: penicillin-binding protein 2, partial [Legionellales bacterium]|nr:penicillin-binding protein 2 [Legionellales bacterium]